eukprot:5767655-Amphidinium_carterae.1
MESTLWEQFRSWFAVENSSIVHDFHDYEFEYACYYVGYYAKNGGDYHYEYYEYYYVEPDVVVATGYVDKEYDYGIIFFCDYHVLGH